MNKQKRDWLAASLLALFLGEFGVQWFYIRKPVAGILSLLFFWTGIPWIIGIIQGIVWLFQGEDEWNRRHNAIA